MSLILYFILGYLTLTTVILLMNRRDFTPLHEATGHRFSSDSPLVSICIPARNEEQTIERCIHSAMNQSYPNAEVLVLDDRSTDSTPALLNKLINIYGDSLHFIPGTPKPADWIGKSWACQQLANASSGDILIFIDADAWLEQDAAARVVRTMGHDTVDMLTVWPMQQLQTFWEKIVIPLVYYALLSLLPARYVYRTPKWIPPPFKKQSAPFFSAACGQFMAFKRKAYQAIGNHRSVKNKVVEDVALARQIKKTGFRMRMYHGERTVSCRMYESEQQMFEGFRRNFLAGFGNNILLFTTAGLIHFFVFLLPSLTLISGLYLQISEWVLLSGAAILIIIYHRLLLARWFAWSPAYAISHPVGVIWFQWLGIRVLKDYFRSQTLRWKGRSV